MAEFLLGHVVAGDLFGGEGLHEFVQVLGLDALVLVLGIDIGLHEFLHLLPGLALVHAFFHGLVGLAHRFEVLALLFLELVVDGPEDLGFAFGQVDLLGQEGDFLGPDALAPALAAPALPAALLLLLLGQSTRREDGEQAQDTNNLLHN